MFSADLLFVVVSLCFFFFNDTATTEIYTLSLHDALPIWSPRGGSSRNSPRSWPARPIDRKSTRLNSSHQLISYAVFCLKKKKIPCDALTVGPLKASRESRAQPGGGR